MKIIQTLLISLVGLVVNEYSFASDMPMPLVKTDWLANNLEQVQILDIRTSKENFLAKPVYVTDKKTGKVSLVKVGGHIPNANFILYKNMRGKHIINGANVDYMLPSKSLFENLMQQAGINNDKPIVVVTNAEYESDVTMAARVYWQIKYYGQEEIAILDGGTAQWLIDGYDISSTSSKISTGNWEVKAERRELLASSEDVVAAMEKDIQLVDIRPLGQYLGVHKSSKVGKNGHIPSAKSFPTELITNKKMPVKFLSISQLQETFNALGIKSDANSITYCNSGHMAAGGWFAMYALLGNENVKLYDGSMHQWTLEKRPVESMRME